MKVRCPDGHDMAKVKLTRPRKCGLCDPKEKAMKKNSTAWQCETCKCAPVCERCGSKEDMKAVCVEAKSSRYGQEWRKFLSFCEKKEWELPIGEDELILYFQELRGEGGEDKAGQTKRSLVVHRSYITKMMLLEWGVNGGWKEWTKVDTLLEGYGDEDKKRGLEVSKSLVFTSDELQEMMVMAREKWSTRAMYNGKKPTVHHIRILRAVLSAGFMGGLRPHEFKTIVGSNVKVCEEKGMKHYKVGFTRTKKRALPEKKEFYIPEKHADGTKNTLFSAFDEYVSDIKAQGLWEEDKEIWKALKHTKKGGFVGYTKQLAGKSTASNWPKTVGLLLGKGMDEARKYTAYCYRRSSATEYAASSSDAMANCAKYGWSN
eukprot:TRINITY_DN12087_c0_g2_i1.p2 TRINITY_DN12087_c0_g2~~TRINITY_DN12087_c0_g2_i1.p2  ORF type:complete len:374 (+),score=150.99 TRINITY_DN12087_c0_g2_i1:55-1176(+)